MEKKLKLISISGGFWTGSGALVGIFSQFEQYRIVPTEFTLFSHGQFFANLKHFSENPGSKKNREELKKDLYRFKNFNSRDLPLFYRVLRFSAHKLGYYPKSIVVRRSYFGKQLGSDYIKACNVLHDYILAGIKSSTQLNRSQIETFLTNIFVEISKTYFKGDFSQNTLVFDQMVAPAYFYDFSYFFPSGNLIFVDRNWRDQYAELRDEIFRMVSNKLSLGVEANGVPLTKEHLHPMRFLEDIRTSIDLQKTELKDDPNVLWMDFEDMVTHYESEYLDKILDFIGEDRDSIQMTPSYKADDSQKNIGKWKDTKWVNEIEKLEKIITQ